ncbi:DUF1642 domain-containing protein [Lactococcus petauri]|uniref:DUF1642 domain-containing protein n=1 Tax=Lactococcus petauri TaxID=1940789 RepID=UPI00385420B4
MRNQPVYSKCDIVGLSNGWVSPEDHQKVVEDLTNARSSITNLTAQLDYYKKDKRFEAMAEEILSLKSQIKKQQPEIPEFMANYIEAAKEDFWTLLSAMDDSNLSSRVGDWLKGGNFRNQEIFAQAWLNGYTVAKEKWFYLKSDKQLYDKGEDRSAYLDLYLDNDGDFVTDKIDARKFTQQEIDSMETGSYERVGVEE